MERKYMMWETPQGCLFGSCLLFLYFVATPATLLWLNSGRRTALLVSLVVALPVGLLVRYADRLFGKRAR